MHQYREWLVGTVANILDDDLSISSAGLLREGAVAWVEVSVPESITTPEGVEFRPNLLATTSFDGSIATTFKRTVTDVVCDNTREAALAEKGQAYKVKHSRNSHAQLGAGAGGPGGGAHDGRGVRQRDRRVVPYEGRRTRLGAVPGPASSAPRHARGGVAGTRTDDGRTQATTVSSVCIGTILGWLLGPAQRTG